MGGCHSTHRPENPGLRAIFIAPTKGVFHSTGYSLKSGVTGDFHRPYEAQKFLHFTIRWPTERVTKETRNQYEIS